MVSLQVHVMSAKALVMLLIIMVAQHVTLSAIVNLHLSTLINPTPCCVVLVVTRSFKM